MADQKLNVDSDACIGCGACVAIMWDTNILALDEDMKSYVKRQPENEEEWELAQDAADSCVVDAISIDEDEE